MPDEAVKDSEKQVVPPSEKKQEPTPSPESKEAPSEPTPEVYTKEKVAELISTAEASVQAAKDKEKAALVRQHKQELKTLQAKQEEARLAILEEKERERFGEAEPETLKEIQELRRRVYASASQTSEVLQHGYAFKLSKQYGVDPEVLLDSASFEEMETKAKELGQQVEKNALKQKEERIKQLEEELAIAKKPPQKIDSSIPTIGGVNWRELSAEETLRKGLSIK